jgi:RNA polymerase sigma-70 factor (ECF subfamily)
MNQTVVRESRRSHAYTMSTAISSPRGSDCAVAQAAAKGLTANIGALYERYRQRVYLLCLRMTGNRAEAEDLTQEVFIQLLLKVASFRGESQFTTWLHRLTVNQVLMHFRRSNRRQKILSTPEIRIPKVHQNSGVVERIALDVALTKLPPGSRAVFLKFDVEGYNHGEIASILGCSVGNSKSQLHKARKKLRRLLSGTSVSRKSSQVRQTSVCP